MRRITCAAGLALVMLAGLAPLTAAPDEPDQQGEQQSTPVVAEQGDQSPARVVVEEDQKTICRQRCGSQDSTRVVVEKELTFELQPPPQAASCQATIAFQYDQRDTIASVTGTIENGDCAASSGDYTILVSIRDEKGESKTLEFNESWQRDDDQPVQLKSEYRIGENVDLVRVRSRQSRCTCADAAEQ